MTLATFFEKMTSYNDDIALIHKGNKVSYKALINRIKEYRVILDANAISSGTPVVLNADFSIESVAMLLALYANRNVIAPLVEITESAKKTLIEHGAFSHVVSMNNGKVVFSTLGKLTVKPTVVMYEKLYEKESSGLVLLSSGSTGTPKAIIHDLDDLVFSKLNKKAKTGLPILMFLLFDHIGGINSLLNTLCIGAMAILPDERTPKEICSLIERYKVKVLPTSPTFLNLILMSGLHERYDFSSLRMITYGTEGMPQGLLNRLHKALPKAKLLQTYGTSETGISVTSSQSSSSVMFKISGKDTKYRIVNGELQLKSKAQFIGYLNAEDSNVTDDGWFKTGDLVEEKDGYLRISGRSREVINVGGEKVLPLEVEGVLLKHPAIDDCLVYPQPNSITGQAVYANIYSKTLTTNRELRKQVKEFLSDHLEPYKIPVKLKLVDALESTKRFKKSRVAL